jgi:predicted GIY-YIG superfamily endonuclease
MSWFVYILRCANQSYYVGHTSDPEARFLRHRNSDGAHHTATYPPEAILYQERYYSELAAIRRERQLKRWSRAKKEALIAGDKARLHELSRSRSSRP